MSTKTTARYNRILPEENRISEIPLVKIQNGTSPQRIQQNLAILHMKNEKNNDVQSHLLTSLETTQMFPNVGWLT